MSQHAPQVESISAESLKALMDDDKEANALLVVDVRDEDREEGWIRNSRHISTTLLRSGSAQRNNDKMDELVATFVNEQRRIVVFHCMFSQCRGPNAASRFAQALAKNPTASSSMRVAILTGGFIAWRQTFPKLVEMP